MTIAVIFFFILFLLIGIPISLVLAMTTILYIILSGNLSLLESTPQRLFSGLDNSGLLAIPLFMLAGELMNGGGITTRLVKVAKVSIGFIRGGLAYVTVIANMLLASILGSATAQAASQRICCCINSGFICRCTNNSTQHVIYYLWYTVRRFYW